MIDRIFPESCETVFYSNNFYDSVLIEPARHNCDKLQIITGFTDTECISRHMIALGDEMKEGRIPHKITVDIILGMTNSARISKKKHSDLIRLVNRINSSKSMPKLSLRYVYKGLSAHSKIYIWSSGDQALLAFSGSANYTMNAFGYRERDILSYCDSSKALSYWNNELFPDTVDCLNPDIFKLMKFTSSDDDEKILPADNLENLSFDKYMKMSPVAVANISLLTGNGETGYGSGINWGIRRNGTKRNRKQAYIPYNKRDRIPDFFPLKTNPNDKNNPIFKVVTKNFGSFFMRVAQQGNKAIHSAESNAIIGEMIRKTIGAKDGEFVTRKMLEKYGRTYVTFRKYQDGVYTLDF